MIEKYAPQLITICKASRFDYVTSNNTFKIYKRYKRRPNLKFALITFEQDKVITKDYIKKTTEEETYEQFEEFLARELYKIKLDRMKFSNNLRQPWMKRHFKRVRSRKDVDRYLDTHFFNRIKEGQYAFYDNRCSHSK